MSSSADTPLPVSVLIAEDDADHRELATRSLRDAGFEVRAVATGEDALASLEGVDLILLDYRLPRMSGLETLEQIRGRRGPPVVMITGVGSEHVVIEAMRAGAVDYIVKNPGYLTALPQALERTWSRYEASRRAAELQRLALVAACSDGPQEVFDGVVRSVRMQLRARACAFYLESEEGVTLQALDGALAADAGEMAEGALALGASPAPRAESADRLFVAVPSSRGKPLGVLAVLTEARVRRPEEIELARAFASFLGPLLERERAQRELRRSEERFRLLVEGAQDYAIFALDEQGLVAGWNSGGERLLGYRASEILGRHVCCLQAGDDVAAGLPDAALAAARTAGRFESEGWRVRADGSRFFASVAISLLQEKEGPRGFVTLIRDVTERRRTEDLTRRIQESRARRRQALALNDSVVQSLVATKLAMELGNDALVEEHLRQALTSAAHIVGDLLSEVGGSEGIQAGTLRRVDPAGTPA